jgi:hypothetical protein
MGPEKGPLVKKESSTDLWSVFNVNLNFQRSGTKLQLLKQSEVVPAPSMHRSAALAGGEWTAARLCRFAPWGLTPAPIGYEVGWTVDRPWTMRRSENFLPYWDSNSGRSVVQQVDSRYNDYTTLHYIAWIQIKYWSLLTAESPTPRQTSRLTVSRYITLTLIST